MTTPTSLLQHLSDEELVVGALLGHIGAFDEIVRRFRTAVTLVAQGIVRSREVAEEVAQETFLAAYRALPQLDHPSRLPAWLCAIARRRALRVAASERRSEATEAPLLDYLLLEQSRELSPDPVEEALRRIEAAFLQAALAKLSPEIATVLHLYYYEDWSVGEIGEFLSLPATTVKWRLHQGRHRLRQQLSGAAAASNESKENNHERIDYQRDDNQRGNNQRDAIQPGDAAADPANAQPDGGQCPRRQHDGCPGPGRKSRRKPVQCGAAVS